MVLNATETDRCQYKYYKKSLKSKTIKINYNIEFEFEKLKRIAMPQVSDAAVEVGLLRLAVASFFLLFPLGLLCSEFSLLKQAQHHTDMTTSTTTTTSTTNSTTLSFSSVESTSAGQEHTASAAAAAV